ncbi:DUF3782 domain-containing protein [Ectothiorhodospira shaposhnikovii]|uniref:DUF3782 domain-containing protein n=1 Tax=Ectothiorhodospira shaposhnikovii TaxID=1054 RepID=UPI0039A0B801
MTQANPTLDDVWRLFQETDRLIKESAQETDRKFKETDRKFQETDRKFKETDRKFQETDRKIQETDRLIKQLAKNLGDIGNRLGEFVEHMVAPAVVRLFRDQGIEVHAVYPNIRAKRNGVALEIDLLVVNDGVLIGVECKSKLVEAHVDAHLERLGHFKRVLPIYKDHRVMGAVAGMVVEDKVAQYALDRGLYVLCQNGEQIDLRTPPGFQPVVW